ncbi:MAG TPA: vitamin K epoxide reductase family protein [Candidatus Dormibacteraeota bacterium]|nr:vitamin K epoxide reductase family protein [Candidatus Dormibacteraeota bacterium]
MNERALRIAIAVFAVLGLAIAGYLTYIHYAELNPVCVGGGQACEKVQSSSASKLAGIPVAVLGLVGYAGILLSAGIRGEAGRLLGALLAISGLAFSLYLTYQELFVIHAVCQWCVASAVIMAILSVLTAMRVLAAPALAPAAPQSA